MFFHGQFILTTLGHNFSFSVLKSREKAKDDSSRLRFLMSLKGQVLRWTFSLRESKSNESDYYGESRKKGLPDQSKNCNIHLGDKLKRNYQGLMYGNQSSRMLCSVHCDR